MPIFLIRHAIAEAHAASARDVDRRLTDSGRAKFARAVRGLKALGIRPERIWTSPAVRALETAELLAEGLGGPEPVPLAALSPGGSPRDVLRALRGAPEAVALVGHQPDLGRLLSLLTTGAECDAFPLGKGGAACIAFQGALRAGAGTLEWLLTPRQLRRLG